MAEATTKRTGAGVPACFLGATSGDRLADVNAGVPAMLIAASAETRKAAGMRP
jgi:hypothetical protein